MCSDSAIAPLIGQNIGTSHQCSASGTVWAFHHKIQVVKIGSPASCGTTVERRSASGQVTMRVSAV